VKEKKEEEHGLGGGGWPTGCHNSNRIGGDAEYTELKRKTLKRAPQAGKETNDIYPKGGTDRTMESKTKRTAHQPGGKKIKAH